MSLYRLVSRAIRSRTVLERLTIPCAASTVNRQIEPAQRNSEILGIDAIDNFHTTFLSTRAYSKKVSKKHQKGSSSSSSSDSDSDGGRKKHGQKRQRQGQSAFWRQKMRTHHMILDVNKDGVVSWDDFEVLIKNFATLGNLAPKELEMFTDAMKHVWEEEWGASGDPYAFVGQEQFLSTMEHAINMKELRKKVARPLQYFFKAVDWDNSGEISIDEFKTFFKCLCLSEESAIVAFAAIDLNGDGRLSQKEFVRLGRDFFLKEDENDPSKLFWGPLSK